MLSILSDGDDRYRIEDDSSIHVGWINGRAIGFRGFATEAQAMAGAVTAWRALHLVLRRQYPGWPNYHPAFDALRLVHDGAYEWVADATSPIARLIRPQRRAYDLTFGIELVLPSYASEGVAVTAAHAVGAALARRVPDDAASPLAGSPSSVDLANAGSSPDGGDAA